MYNKYDVPSKWTKQMGQVVAETDRLAADAYDTSAGLEAMRIGYGRERTFWNRGGPQPARIQENQVMTPHGEVRVRTYYPTDSTALPYIVYIHGGGFVLGNPDTHDRITRILANHSGAAVVSIDYTLAPEAKYPQALEECVAVVQHLREHAEEWSIQADDISFAGDSGGAHLALATYLHLREIEKASEGVRCLLLFYGFFGLNDSVSRRLLGGTWDGLTQADWDYYLGMYLNNPDEIRAPYVDLFSQDLSRDIPPCYVASAALDPLLDDSRLLAAILKEANLPLRYEEFSGVIHAFLHNSLMLDEANDALEHAATFYRDCPMKTKQDTALPNGENDGFCTE